jgi:hypothetical protein
MQNAGSYEASLRTQYLDARRRLFGKGQKEVLLPKPMVVVPPPELRASDRVRGILKLPRVNQTITDVAAARGVTPGQIAGRSREFTIAAARFEVFFRLHRAGFSLSQIGRFFGRHHTSIQHGIRKHLGEPVKGERKAAIAAGKSLMPLLRSRAAKWKPTEETFE